MRSDSKEDIAERSTGTRAAAIALDIGVRLWEIIADQGTIPALALSYHSDGVPVT